MTKVMATFTDLPQKGIVRYPASVKCSAKSRRTGEPCGNYAIRGGTVCRHHGGQLPNVKRSAAKNVEIARHELIKKALDTLVEASPEVAERLVKMALADPDKVRPDIIVKAATSVLDRAGIGPTSKVESESVHINVNASDIVRARLERLNIALTDGTVVQGELAPQTRPVLS